MRAMPALPYLVYRANSLPRCRLPGWERQKEAHSVLSGIPGLKYCELADIPNGWDYQNRYGSFRWWTA